MAEQQVTFEQLESQLKNVNWSDYQKGGKKHFTSAEVAAAPGDVLQKICDIYHKVRGILAAILVIPLIPGFIKDAIRAFMALMDGICH